MLGGLFFTFWGKVEAHQLRTAPQQQVAGTEMPQSPKVTIAWLIVSSDFWQPAVLSVGGKKGRKMPVGTGRGVERK